jgi:hypothetical protein
MIRSGFAAVLAAPVFCVVLPAFAAITATRHSDPLPSEIQAPLAAQLAAGGVRASVDGKPVDFWWTAGVSLSATGPADWAAVPEGALIGAVRFGSDFRDIRGKVIKPGVYTLRYGIQPDNGDHLGVSPHRQFLLISPANDDRNPAPQGHEGTIDLSKAAIGGSHPAVLSIDPPAAGQQPLLSTHKTDLGHEALIVEVPATRDGKPQGALRFGIVLIGRIEA